MFSWIPIEYYTGIYYHLLLGIVLITWVNTRRFSISDAESIKSNHVIGMALLFFILLYMGLRPISGRYFGDMGTYSKYFEGYQQGNEIAGTPDIGFNFFMRVCSYFMNVKVFFLLCTAIYVLPLLYIAKKWFKSYWFYAFLFLVCSFSFWSYGTNGIRNGMSTSLFLLAISFSERKIILVVLMLLACSIHKSMLIPAAAYGLTLINNDPEKYFFIWLAAIPLSLAMGGFWENFFAGLGLGDERAGYLTSGNINNDDFSSTGFRWDFLVYSATGVLSGYYFVIKRNFGDKLYIHLVNIYLLVNAFWILVIRANFSNRFAYLSWFMLAIVIVYPFLKQRFFSKPHRTVGTVLFIYYMFTYVMFLINK